MSNTHEKREKLEVTGRLQLGKHAKLVDYHETGIVSLTGDYDVRDDDSGKTFFLNNAGGGTVTLPAPRTGFKAKFIVATAPTTNFEIVTTDGDDIMIGGINELEVDTADDGPYDTDADNLTFVANVAVVGDFVEFVCDGTNWYFNGQTNADGGVTLATT